MTPRPRVLAVLMTAAMCVSGGSATYLSIYAPGTSVSVSGDSPLFGALVGKTLTVTGNSALHYDVALPDIFSVFEP